MTGMIYNILKNPNELKPHKTNVDIYGTEPVDADLVESIKNKGILEPLVIVDGNIILSGHRRWLAAKELKLKKIPCRSMSFSDELDEKEALIEFNRQRKKTYSQLMNEADMIEDIVKARNKAKQSELASGAHLKESDKQVPLTSAEAEPKRSDNETREIVSDKIGISRDKYIKVKKVWDTAKTGDTYAKSLVDKLDKKEVTVNEAANRVKAFNEAPGHIKEKIIKEDLSAKEATAVVKKEEKKEQLQIKKEKFKQQSRESIKENKPTIYYKDSIEWLTSLDNDSADLLITDPVYITDVDNIIEFSKWALLALKKVKPDGKAYICTGPYPQELSAYLTVLLSQDKFEISNILVWTYRNTLGPSPKKGYKNNWQAIFYLVGKNTDDLNCPVMLEQFSVQDINAPDGRLGNRFHAWQKPDELADRLIRHSTKENDIVIDPFSGTGTFLISAAKLNRIAFGCDNNLEILSIAKERGCNVIQ
jgi:DNA modification methylase